MSHYLKPQLWASIFNDDSMLTSALLNRLLHQAETISIEGAATAPRTR